jgi:hypothetical protein
MSAFKILGLAFGLLLSFITLSWAFFSMALSWTEGGGHWTIFQWVLGLVISALPPLLSFWIVYWCFCTGEMDYRDIFGFEVRPKAMRRALLAELCVCGVMVAFWLAFSIIVPILARRIAA